MRRWCIFVSIGLFLCNSLPIVSSLIPSGVPAVKGRRHNGEAIFCCLQTPICLRILRSSRLVSFRGLPLFIFLLSWTTLLCRVINLFSHLVDTLLLMACCFLLIECRGLSLILYVNKLYHSIQGAGHLFRWVPTWSIFLWLAIFFKPLKFLANFFAPLKFLEIFFLPLNFHPILGTPYLATKIFSHPLK